VTGLRRELGLASLAAIVFFNVSGGPYGIEDVVPSFGPGLTLVLLVLTPLVWSLPVALAMSELASAIPDEGGYVTWVRRAFGPFWSFQVGWWSWIDSFVDVAVYPALFVEYVRFWWPGMTSVTRWLLALAFIALLTALNLAGVRPVGRLASALAIATLAPIAVFVICGFVTASRVPWQPFTTRPGGVVEGLGLGLAVVMWNYSGWDTPSTCLGETRNPERTFRSAQLLVVAVITAAYVLPVAAGLGSAIDRTAWTTGALPSIATGVGGPWLGHAVAIGAVLSTAGLFMSLLLTNSRLPFVLARAGLLPDAMQSLTRRTGVPWLAIVASAAVYAVCAAFSFKELVVLDVWLYSLSLVVELAAFIVLRRREPSLARPWRVPGGAIGALFVTVVPSAVAMLAMVTAGVTNTMAGIAAASTGPLAYFAAMRTRSRWAKRALPSNPP